MAKPILYTTWTSSH